MKKVITILLMAALLLSMAACSSESGNDTPTSGGNDTPTTPTQEGTPELQGLSLGDTITTDFMEFTLDSAQLATAIETDNFTPIEYSPEVKGYIAEKGHTFVILDFTIKNIDRVRYLYAYTDGYSHSEIAQHYLEFKIEYNGDTYIGSSTTPHSYSVQYLMVKDNNGLWEIINNKTPRLLDVGETKTIRCYFDIPVEVNSLTDIFDVNIAGTSNSYIVSSDK